MLPTTLKIRYNGKKIKIDSEKYPDIVSEFRKEIMQESVRKLRRLLIEVYLDNPLNYKSYIENLFSNMIAKINTDSGIIDLYILLEPEGVATNFFMNLGVRKVTIAMKPAIVAFQSIATIINNIKKEVRFNGGLVIKTNSNEALEFFANNLKNMRISENLLEVYFDEGGAKIVKEILNIFDQLVSLRLLSRGNQVIINIHREPMEMIDVRGLANINHESLIRFLSELKALKNKACNLHIETNEYIESLNNLIINLLKKISPSSCLDIIIIQRDNDLDLKLMHELGIFRIILNRNYLRDILLQLDALTRIIDLSLNNRIFINISIREKNVEYRILPEEKKKKTTTSNWIGEIESAIISVLNTRGRS